MNSKSAETNPSRNWITDEVKIQWLEPSFVILRVALGWVFFYAGVTKVLNPTWTAGGYLENAVPAANPLTGVWPVLATLPAVDLLVQWGLTLTGLGLIVGALLRWNAFWASVMMLSFWASSVPLEHALLVDEHIIYVLALVVLSALGAGRIAGLDALLEETSVVKSNPWLRYLLG